MSDLEVMHDGQFYSFACREPLALNGAVGDRDVVREIWHENVYQVEEGDLDDTGLIFDIGANIGAFSVYGVALGAKKVYAFEPDPENFGQLVANAKPYDKIKPIQLGIAGKAKSIGLTQGHGGSYIDGVPAHTAQGAGMTTQPNIQIKCISLASAFADYKVANIDILKMDVEGAEYEIFEAAPPEIIAKARYITMEFHPADETVFGRLIAKLSLTHNLHIIGKHNEGGQIYGRRY